MYTTILSKGQGNLSEILTRGETKDEVGMSFQQGERGEKPNPQPRDTGKFSRSVSIIKKADL
jgi:hypothetical protein